MKLVASDLQVVSLSDCLAGKSIDLVVTGSIAALEAFHLVRSLRAFGAEVTVYLSQGAQQFVTKEAFEWSSAREVITTFDGLSSHLATGEVCVVAPVSASFLAKTAAGICDHPSTTLVQSHLGAGHRVMMVPCMHGTLYNSTFTQKNIHALKEAGVVICKSRLEEGKYKFPNPLALAMEISHHIHRPKNSAAVVISMGATRVYLDPVRFMAPHSSGELGTHLAHELYAHSFITHVVCGDAAIRPHSWSAWYSTPTYEEMYQQISSLATELDAHFILAAAVSDYLPENALTTKIKSGQSTLTVDLKPSAKIRHLVSSSERQKVCFKLETQVPDSQERARIMTKMSADEGATMVVFNSPGQKEAYAVSQQKDADTTTEDLLTSKRQIAAYLNKWLLLVS